MLKVYGINVYFALTLALKEYVLNTWLNIDNYGWPLMRNEICT